MRGNTHEENMMCSTIRCITPSSIHPSIHRSIDPTFIENSMKPRSDASTITANDTVRPRRNNHVTRGSTPE
jgi:hypothetical protein